MYQLAAAAVLAAALAAGSAGALGDRNPEGRDTTRDPLPGKDAAAELVEKAGAEPVTGGSLEAQSPSGQGFYGWSYPYAFTFHLPPAAARTPGRDWRR